jgi:DNA mismatch repair protein MutS
MENHLCITALKIHDDKQFMNLDITARRNLEITQTMRAGDKKGSLLWVLDKTKTAMGRRLIRTFLEQPLMNRIKIEKRLNAVEELYKRPVLLEKLRTLLSDITDIERLITRIAYSSASPRDIKSLQYTCEKMPELLETLSHAESRLLTEQFENIDSMADIRELIESAINDDLPVAIKDGGVIRKGYNADLDELRDIISNAKGYLAKLEADEKEKTGIKTLKIGYNRVFGYYIEVSKSFVNEVPETYIRKQTLTTGERYITEELKELESKILTASTKIQSLELALFNHVREHIAKQLLRVQKTAQSIAYIDVLASFAKVAIDNSYTRPDISNKDEIIIKEGRHPVVENLLKDTPFVSNDTYLDNNNDRICIITGPNMAGKSTYMRQVAVIVLMAQIGSFVPAKSATVGIVDSIFTRVGASDDLASGQSTFMVEMNEVATILKDATSKSLVILDEVGRGTSTFDGMSIARAVVEYIADPKKIGAKTLFATHYHELTAMENELSCVKNYNVAVKKRGDDITFLRRIVKGNADDSYGIEVAKLAGIPNDVVKRAKEVLLSLTNGTLLPSAPKTISENKESDNYGQLDLYSTAPTNEALLALKALDVETLTPIEALNKLYELKKLAE